MKHKVNSYSRILVLILLNISGLVSCSGPQTLLLNRPVYSTETTRALINSNTLAKESTLALKKENLFKLYKKSPRTAMLKFSRRYNGKFTDCQKLLLAEMASDTADRELETQTLKAIGLYLDCANLCSHRAMKECQNERESRSQALYNHSVSQLVRSFHTLVSIRGPIKTSGILKNYHLSIDDSTDQLNPKVFDLIVPSSWIKLKKIEMAHTVQKGFGSSMVGWIKATPERQREDPLMPNSGFGIPLNAHLKFSGKNVQLILKNLNHENETTIGQKKIPLNADFTAALAFMYYQNLQQNRKILATLRPSHFDSATKLFTLEPYDSEKVPLILVHGLLATAENWLPFINLLKTDKLFRENYQLILFNYPSGYDIVTNAISLRKALLNFYQNYEPLKNSPHLENSIILGHSMGGILSNLQIRNSKDKIEEFLFKKKFDKTHLNQQKVKLFYNLIHFDAISNINRAIFIATPHRGSQYASNIIGKIGSWLVRTPFSIMDTLLGESQLVRSLNKEVLKIIQHPANSVNSLRPDNPALEIILQLPLNEGIKIHSIIAQKNRKNAIEEGSDGVVTYRSAHIDNVSSEKIIWDATHSSVLRKISTINEVCRILKDHMNHSNYKSNKNH